MRYRWIIWIMIVVAGIGFADAGYLTLEHVQEGVVNCGFFGGCDIVTGSEYGQIGPVPTSALGVLYYGVILVGMLAALVRNDDHLARGLSMLTVGGLLASIGFVYLQLFVLRAICVFCMISAGTSTLLFLLGMAYLILWRSGMSAGVAEIEERRM